jgi:hypothetical protein
MGHLARARHGALLLLGLGMVRFVLPLDLAMFKRSKLVRWAPRELPLVLTKKETIAPVDSAEKL